MNSKLFLKANLYMLKMHNTHQKYIKKTCKLNKIYAKLDNCQEPMSDQNRLKWC